MFVLSQNWPQTSYWYLNDKWQEAEAEIHLSNQTTYAWTLHGLWPTSNKNRFFPKNCRIDSSRFERLNFKLLSDMKKHWYSCNSKVNNRKFWKHEWIKHGSCANDLNTTNSLKKYFSKSVTLLKNYNVGNVLRKHGIVPGKEYFIRNINKALFKTWGVKTQVICAKSPVNI